MNLVVWFFFSHFFLQRKGSRRCERTCQTFCQLLLLQGWGTKPSWPWILGKSNPTNCCVKYLPGLLLLWGLQTKKIYSVIFFYLFFVSQQPNGHRRGVDFNAWRSQRQSTKGRWPWAQKQHSQSGSTSPGATPPYQVFHQNLHLFILLILLLVCLSLYQHHTLGDSHHHIILLFHF